MTEIFKDVKGYEGLYQVSNLGRVKSLKRKVKNGKGLIRINEIILRQNEDSSGYLMVGFSKNGKTSTKHVHKLVAITFLNHKPNGLKVVVDHINNNKIDNRIENLQLISHRENMSKDQQNKTSKYTGISWNKNAKKWRAQIRINKKQVHLGYFKTEEEAAEVYQNKLKTL